MFEEKVKQSLFSPQTEKTYIDKILARQDVESIRSLIKKSKLTRQEINELLYLLTSVESKLLNYSEWDRYVILKFFVWIRETAKVTELLFDYQDDLLTRETTCIKCKKRHPKLKLQSDITCKCKKFKPVRILTDRTKQHIYNNERLIEHNTKFLVDLYLNIGRTSLSLGATGIMELLKNKYELYYPNMQQQQQDKGGMFNFFKK